MCKIKTYSTIEVARIIGIHSNTVRLYEKLELIPKPTRKSNGYRVFTDRHIDQFKLDRIAFQVELLQNGLRKIMIVIVKKSAKGYFDEAIELAEKYIILINTELDNAKEAVDIVNDLLLGNDNEYNEINLRRKQVSDKLNISMDTLRNWEMNGLITVKRKENGYRVYNYEDIQRLKVIRSLRCANYSLSAILRMLNAVSRDIDANIYKELKTPNEEEDIVSVCDKLIISLNSAKENAQKILKMLLEMKNKYSNSPL